MVVFKRSMNRGYADVENPLFFFENTNMCFGDAKNTMESIVAVLREKAKSLEKHQVGSTLAAAKQQEEFDYAAIETFMTVGVPKETGEEETRVAMTPEAAKKIRKLGFQVLLEKGAGDAAKFSEEEYTKAGVTDADIVLKLNEPLEEEVALLREGQLLVSYASPAQNSKLLAAVAAQGAKWLAMDNVPRTTIAQKLDSLSSMGKISGYRAVIEACNAYEGFFGPQITAAGKYPPCKMLIIGGGA